MADLAIPNTFVDGAVITASGHNQNNDAIKNYINDRNDGNESWDNLDIADGSVSGTLTVTGTIDTSGDITVGATGSLEVAGSLVATGVYGSTVATRPNINIDASGNVKRTTYVTEPAGVIQMYGAASAPTGWLLCDGAAVSRTTYADLFAVVGVTFGSGDGVNTFNIPDMRGVFPKGAGTTNRTLGKDASGNFYAATLGAYALDMMQGHHHKVMENSNASFSFGGATTVPYVTSNTSSNSVAVEPVTDATHGTPRTGYTTEPQSLGLSYIIKT